MYRRGRLRRAVRWGGVALTAALPLLWAGSELCMLSYVRTPGERAVGLSRGAFFTFSSAGQGHPKASGWELRGYDLYIVVPPLWWPVVRGAGAGILVGVPLWIPWLPVAAFTAWRFRADRVKPLHVCQSCGYDRRGLGTAAPCPECGTTPPGAAVPGG